eukprot:TRINITY_DN24143_c0_g1_i1.p1 TRINITY_DN24143_c0_g1~~TRINITY_DN24143_c0_g1_i1.p1  ORF type:complete len:391 (+),score=64.80 TRINITY_DN24143_c0_g1_i1:110-1174(+)
MSAPSAIPRPPVCRITDKLYGARFPLLTSIPPTLTAGELSCLMTKKLFSEPAAEPQEVKRQSDSSVSSSNSSSASAAGRFTSLSQLVLLHDGRILLPDEKIASLPAPVRTYYDQSYVVGPCIDLTCHVQNPLSTYAPTMEAIAARQRPDYVPSADFALTNKPLDFFRDSVKQQALSVIQRRLDNLNERIRRDLDDINGLNDQAQQPNRRRFVFRLHLDMNWVIRVLIFVVLMASEPSFVMIGLLILGLTVIRRLYNLLFGQNQDPVAAAADEPFGGRGGAAAAANNNNVQAAAPRNRVSYLPARGHGRFAFVVEVERFIYGFFASLFPQWQPEEVTAEPAGAPANHEHVAPQAQ